MNKQLRTIESVNFNTGRVTGTATGQVYMTILCATRVWLGGEHMVVVQYKYSATVEGLDTTLKIDEETIKTAEINALAAAVESLIPAEATDCEAFEFKVLFGAKLKFAETFGLSPSAIEILETEA